MDYSKQTLRSEIKKRLKAVSQEELASQSAVIFDKVARSAFFRDARTVAIYNSLADEPSTMEFIARWSGEKDFVLPCVVGEQMVFRHLSDNTTEGCFGICEPTGEIVAPEDIELFVVPGVAFGRAGHRLGRGKGYYDRYLSVTDAPCIGVCFDFQLMDEIPNQPHDQLMDEVIFGQK